MTTNELAKGCQLALHCSSGPPAAPSPRHPSPHPSISPALNVGPGTAGSKEQAAVWPRGAHRPHEPDTAYRSPWSHRAARRQTVS